MGFSTFQDEPHPELGTYVDCVRVLSLDAEELDTPSKRMVLYFQSEIDGKSPFWKRRAI